MFSSSLLEHHHDSKIDGWNALHHAAQSHEAAEVRRLLESGLFDIDATTKGGVTALIAAVDNCEDYLEEKSLETVSLLLKHRAALNLATTGVFFDNPVGSTALDIAERISQGHTLRHPARLMGVGVISTRTSRAGHASRAESLVLLLSTARKERAVRLLRCVCIGAIGFRRAARAAAERLFAPGGRGFRSASARFHELVGSEDRSLPPPSSQLPIVSTPSSDGMIGTEAAAGQRADKSTEGCLQRSKREMTGAMLDGHVKRTRIS
jgi:hypothetical protein